MLLWYNWMCLRLLSERLIQVRVLSGVLSSVRIALKNILVTTPLKDSENAAKEALACIQANGGYYFRSMPKRPANLEIGSKIFYVDKGYIRGFAVVESVSEISYTDEQICSTSGKRFKGNFKLLMRADSWQWIKPIPHKGFQGFRYFDESFEIIGGWRDPMPNV